MNNFESWGVKRRIFPNHNYNAIWYNLKTIRLGEGQAKELPADESEFYDVSLGKMCNACCPWCYVGAMKDGEIYQDICETWKKWMSKFYERKIKENVILTNKPCQIAAGSEGEVTIHPEFCDFLKTVYETNVVPNYTTNGIVLSEDTELSEKILEYTRLYVGGVAVSFGNKAIRDKARKAVQKLIERGECKVNIHHIISDMASVDDFIAVQKEYGSNIAYHVLLPLMPVGRSKKGIEPGVFEYLEKRVQEEGIKNIAFGAHFVDSLKKSAIKTWLYEPESFSKNVLLQKDKVIITPSSFNMNPIKIIEL